LSADSTQMFPPCCSTIPFEITRPSPVPPALASWWRSRAARSAGRAG
jgi:hypothetical protein